MTRDLHFRLLVWYCGAVGAITALPWVAAVLSDEGLADGAIASILMILPVGTLIGGPLWSWMADRADGSVVLRSTTALATAGGLAMAMAPTPELLVAALAVVALTRSGVFPVADSLTLQLLDSDRRSYGRIRAAGSVAFAIAIFAGGQVRPVWPRGPLWIGAALMAVAAGISWSLPKPERRTSRPGLADVARAARDPLLAGLAAVGVLHGITMTTYDHLFSIHIEGMGLSSGTAGAALALGVTVEVAVLWYGRRLMAALGPMPLLAIAVASGIPRWILTGTSTDPTVLVLTQALHGIGFGAYWVAGVALFDERAPPALAASAQALFTVSTFGLGYLASMGIAAVVLSRADTAMLFLGLAAVSTLATIFVGTLGKIFATPVQPS